MGGACLLGGDCGQLSSFITNFHLSWAQHQKKAVFKSIFGEEEQGQRAFKKKRKHEDGAKHKQKKSKADDQSEPRDKATQSDDAHKEAVAAPAPVERTEENTERQQTPDRAPTADGETVRANATTPKTKKAKADGQKKPHHQQQRQQQLNGKPSGGKDTLGKYKRDHKGPRLPEGVSANRLAAYSVF